MRLESLTLAGFGAFQDSRRAFAPGLNVIYGPNESGKSTWHAAACAALCGQRRGRGQAREEREFEERHRPWDGRDWEVRAVLELADGRRVELRQDLGRKISSQAIDLALGRDISGEILSEGMPDASRWLGLDRQAFQATACVRQADVLAVTEEPARLTEHLQRAAATAGVDGTAAAALGRIDEYRRQHVGRDRAGSSKPLRQSREAVQRARLRLDEARHAHQRYLDLAARLEELTRREELLQAELGAYEAADAWLLATELVERVERATELAGRHPQAPPAIPADDELVRRAQLALHAWRERASPPMLSGPSARELHAQLLELRAAEAQDPIAESELLTRREAAEAARRAARSWFPGWPGVAMIALPLATALVAGAARQPVVATVAICLAILAGGASYVARVSRATRAIADLRDLERRLDRAGLTAERRRALEQQLQSRTLLERAAAGATASRARAEAALQEAAARCGLESGDAASLAGGLEAWLRGRAPDLEQRQRALREWTELGSLLGKASLEELRHQAERQRAAAAALAGKARPDLLQAARGHPDPATVAARLREERGEIQRQAAEARGSLREAERQLPNVPEAEEGLLLAESELSRVQDLARILDLTQAFLEQAQEQVHRDIAPVLAATLRGWLPRVTRGRYTDAAVDPETLEVRVCGPRRTWRRAVLLSQGTREQVYLLLRIALVEHLTRPGERCPLLFDEVTVHSDTRRTEALLRLLHEVSATHQVLLFTQEDEVAEWARAALHAPADQLLLLDGPPADA